MDSCEVLIIGGGPAGSACAWALKNRGCDVVVMDKATFPRDKVCAGWITPAVLDELSIDSREYSHGRVLQPITDFRTGTIGGTMVLTEYDRIVSYGIRRCEFDHFLLQRCGARLRLGEAFQSARQESGEWIVNDTVRAKWLVGAGGHFCPVARQFSEAASNGDSSPVILAQEIEFEMTDAQQAECEVCGTHPELYFCPDLKGYGWVFRKGNVLNIGLGREHETRLGEHVAAFCDFLRTRDRIRFALPTRFHGHAYRLRTQVPRASASNVLLIGDGPDWHPLTVARAFVRQLNQVCWPRLRCSSALTHSPLPTNTRHGCKHGWEWNTPNRRRIGFRPPREPGSVGCCFGTAGSRATLCWTGGFWTPNNPPCRFETDGPSPLSVRGSTFAGNSITSLP